MKPEEGVQSARTAGATGNLLANLLKTRIGTTRNKHRKFGAMEPRKPITIIGTMMRN
jgi:hypothetical protein